MLRSVLPRFEILVDCPAQAVEARLNGHLKRALEQGEGECVGWVEPPYAELHVAQARRHFWSPRLQVTFEGVEGGDKTRIRGVFRPEPEVWTGFVFAHCLFAVAALAGLSFGLARWTLGHTPTAMLWAGGAGLGSLALYLGALSGHRLGHDQMCALRRSFDGALGIEDPGRDPTQDAELECPPERSGSDE